MEYYRELYFEREKHKYDLHNINFYSDNKDNIIEYKNEPTKGFKLIIADATYAVNSFLDPISGYIFYPSNAKLFSREIQRRNLVFNGIITVPIIFEYVKDGSFLMHIYDDVKDGLREVFVEEKVSLSTQKCGTILRNIDDEAYYIYFGLVGQLYVTGKGKATVKKKHLVLKTDTCDFDDDDLLLNSDHFSYVDFNKDTTLSYFKIKETDPTKVRIKYAWYNDDIFTLSDYLTDGRIDLYKLQKNQPDVLLSGTIRKLFSEDDISLTRNKVTMESEYIGEGSIQLNQTIKYKTYDTSNSTFNDVDLSYELLCPELSEVDFNKYNYLIEMKGRRYFVSFRSLHEIDCTAMLKHETDIVNQGYHKTANMMLFKMSDMGIMSNDEYLQSQRKKYLVNWKDPVKIFRVKYVLNGKHEYNIVDKMLSDRHEDDVKIHEPNMFKTIKENNGITIGVSVFDGEEQ